MNIVTICLMIKKKNVTPFKPHRMTYRSELYAVNATNFLKLWTTQKQWRNCYKNNQERQKQLYGYERNVISLRNYEYKAEDVKKTIRTL